MASDVMRVRLHLRQVRVLAVVVDTPSELRVRVESTVRRPSVARTAGSSATGCTTPASARCATLRCRGGARRWCGCGGGSCAAAATADGSRSTPSSTDG